MPDRGVVDEVAGGEVVRTVHDQVPAVGEDALDVLRRESLLVGDDVDVGVERLERPLGRQHLRLSEGVRRVDDLALEVRVVDDVRVDDAERAHSGRREVERRGRAEPAGADQEHTRVEQLLLPFLTDLRDQDVPRVAGALLGAQSAAASGRRNRSASSRRTHRPSRRRCRSRARRATWRANAEREPTAQ